MKKVIFAFAIIVLLTSFVSSEIMLELSKTSYSKGDVLSVPTIIKTNSGVNDFFYMSLICNGQEKEFHKEYVILSQGDERHISPAILLVADSIGDFNGICVVKAKLGEEIVLSKDITIDNKITMTVELKKTDYSPNEKVSISGHAEKTNGGSVNGYIDLTIQELGQEISGTVKDGRYSLEFTLPQETAAGSYPLQFHIYEKDSTDKLTNEGSHDASINVLQVPKNLEIQLQNSITPGENLEFQVILHDQTGEPIASKTLSTIKDNEGKIIEQTEHDTSLPYSFATQKNYLPGKWSVNSISNDLEAESEFTVEENAEVSLEFNNNTLKVTNIGNVPYNKSITVKIGEEMKKVDVNLALGASEEYRLKAQDGEYLVSATDGRSSIEKSLVLTGNAISVEKNLDYGSFGRHIIPWMFIILVFGATIFLFSKKAKERKTGYEQTNQKIKKHSSLTKQELSKTPSGTHQKVKDHEIFGNIDGKAVHSLSIQGQKQGANMICIKIKNLPELKQEKSNVQDTIKSIVRFAEDHKAVPYRNNEFLFFILAPMVTKSFKNERDAVDIAQYAEKNLLQHNKMFKYKINFGISVNRGELVAKYDKANKTLHFSSLGNFIVSSKKIAELAEHQVLLSKNLNERMVSNVRTEKVNKDENVNTYKIDKVITQSDEHKKFIDKFLKSIEPEKKK